MDAIAHTRKGHAAQRGLTLVEMLIAMTLGLLVTSIVLGVYVGASRNLSQNDRYARMQENGRYALRALADDVSMADFWGQMTSTDVISTTLSPPSGNCAVDMTVFDASTPLLLDAYNSGGSAQFTVCSSVAGNLLSGTDVLLVKRVAGSPTARTFVDVNDVNGNGDTTETLTTGAADLVSGSVYLREDGTSGSLIDDASASNPPALGQEDWLYMPYMYYVRNYYETAGDGIPALCRVGLQGTSATAPACIAEGIEDVHVQVGLDTDNDGVANYYTSTPSAADMQHIVTVRIYVLARSSDKDPHYTDSRKYRLGDVTVAAANDGYYRSVYSTTVKVRNIVARNLLN